MTGNRFAMLLISARLAFSSLPEFTNRSTAIVRVLAVPAATSLFYLAISSGAGTSPPQAANAVAAAAGVGAVSAAVSASVLVAQDRFDGTLTFLLIAPYARVTAWTGRLLLVAGLGLVMAAVGLVFSLTVTGQSFNFSQWTAIPLVLVVASLGSVGVGYALGAVSLRMRDSLLLANIAEYALPLLAGVVAPVTALPGGLDLVARLIPLTHAIEAGRTMVATGVTSSFWVQLLASLILGGIWFVLGWFMWMVLEKRARAAGNVDALAVG